MVDDCTTAGRPKSKPAVPASGSDEWKVMSDEWKKTMLNV
jgi:hypothetical protein